MLQRGFALLGQSVPGHIGLEDELSRRVRYLWRTFCLLASLIAIPAAFTFAQQTLPSSGASAVESHAVGGEPENTSGGSSTEKQLHLAEQQGRADAALLDWTLENSGALKGDLRTGELRIAFTVTAAEGWWDKAAGNQLAWHDAPEDSFHLRIFVLDQVDGRFVPGLALHVTLIDANGNEQSAPADFGWYPLINAYGGNVLLDNDSSYTIRVTVEPLLQHHVFAPGVRFERATTAEFPPVRIAQNLLPQLPLASALAAANEAALLKPCNAALSAAITALWQQSVSGAEKSSGDYFVGYALDYSGLSMPIAGSKVHLKSLVDFSGRDDVRLDLLPRDSRTGRLIPGLKPQVSLLAPDGKSYGPGELPLAWNQWLNHYGRTSRIPRKGVYKLRVHINAPGFRRWGRPSERFASPVDVEFDEVSLQPGKKD